MQPFEPGDIFLGLTELNDPTDDHAGRGRIVQYGADLKKKGELWTEGGHHLVGGLNFDRNGVLWAFNDLSVIHVDARTGRQLPLSTKFKPRVYRSASFAADGSVYLGEHMLARDPPPGIAARTTIKFPRLPDTGWLGHGRIYKYDRDWNLVREWDVDHCPEPTGFKGVTHHTLHPSGQFITYTAETSKRIMRFDVVNGRQMPDLVRYPGDDIRDGNWVIALRYLPDGRLLATRSKTMDLIDEQGNTIREYPLGGTYGWAEVMLTRDPRYVLVANIWTGIAARYDLERGEIAGVIDTGYAAPRRSLAGIAEYPG
ncbi:MAG: hypothetical protein FJ197_09225 [Gammaproteobacteria bacterium]|nr:hypothetical protein [Gammaproteobacteria bacterium]